MLVPTEVTASRGHPQVKSGRRQSGQQDEQLQVEIGDGIDFARGHWNGLFRPEPN
jgi:hypothetical protein